jgi:hypothetical protein
MKKKLIAWLCVLAMLLCLVSFVGCKGGQTPEGNEPTDDPTPGPGEGGNPPANPEGPEIPAGPTVPDEVQGGNDPYVPDQEW